MFSLHNVGPRSLNFSMEFNVGGYFLGTGGNKAYVSGKSIWYDDLHVDTWSHLVVEHLVEEIGYEMAGRIKAYYLVPLLDITRNGLRQIRDDDDTGKMCDFVGIGYHSLQIFLDHDDSLNSKNRDDVLHFPVAQLPPVLSPTKCRSSAANVKENEPVPIKIVFPDEEITRLENNEPDGGTANAAIGTTGTIDAECDEAAADADAEEIAAREVEAEIRARNAEAVQAEVQRQRLGQQRRMNGGVHNDADNTDSEDEDFNPGEIVDSDYDISEDDDDLFADNVDYE